MTILILSDDFVMAKHIERQLEEFAAECTTVRSVEETNAALRERAYDLVVISRVTKDRYGDPGHLTSMIENHSPYAKIVVTFVVREHIEEYLEAGVRFFYLGQPLTRFADYIQAVATGQRLPLVAKYNNGDWVPVDG